MEKLKPCPFCGIVPELVDGYRVLKGHRCNAGYEFALWPPECWNARASEKEAQQPVECRTEFEKWWKDNTDGTRNKFGYDKGELEWAWNAAWRARNGQ